VSTSKPPARVTGVQRVSLRTLRAKKSQGERIVAVTAYDATFTHLFEEGGVEILLVGDSLGMVIQGLESTIPVTLDDVLYHCRAVSRTARRCHVVADMPFLSYQVSSEQAVRNAGKLMQEGGAHAVKIEGGRSRAETIARVVDAGIPVMAHVGLLPQQVHSTGGYRTHGVDAAEANSIAEDARAVQAAGAYAVVVEGIAPELAANIRRDLTIPVIGIGAGVECDGQILVGYDVLGLTPDFHAKFVKRYETFYERGVEAVQRYCSEVRSGQFPDEEHGPARKPVTPDAARTS
jgi:3-methyl-2-oxobutanoate hydroxymethyltransferase